MTTWIPAIFQNQCETYQHLIQELLTMWNVTELAGHCCTGFIEQCKNNDKVTLNIKVVKNLNVVVHGLNLSFFFCFLGYGNEW